MKARYFVLFLLTLGAAQAFTIEQAVQKALEKNYSIKKAQLDHDSAKLQTQQSLAGFFPQVDAHYNYSERDRVISPAQNKRESVAGVTVSYNLFNGFKDRYGVKGANFYESAQQLNLQALQKDVALQTKILYITYLQQKKYLQIHKSSQKMLQKQYEDIQNYFKQGLVAQNEVLEVEVQLLHATQDVNSAKRALSLAKKDLENYIGASIYSDITPITLTKAQFAYDKLVQKLSSREEIQALQKIKASSITQLKANRSSFMPQANVSVNYNEYGSSWDLGGDQSPSSQTTTSLELRWNLYSGGVDAAQQQIYRNQTSKANYQLLSLEDDLILQLDRSYTQYKNSKDNLKTANKALNSAQKNYEIMQRQFSQGLIKSSELIDANHLLVSAKTNHADALYTKEIAIQSLKRIASKDFL